MLSFCLSQHWFAVACGTPLSRGLYQMLIFGLWGRHRHGILLVRYDESHPYLWEVVKSKAVCSVCWRGSRGLVNVIIAFVALYFYGKMGESVGGIQGIIVAFSILCIISAVLAWIVIPNRVEGASDSIHLKDVGTVLKIPAVWIIALIVMTCYSVYIGSTYLTPYMTEMLGLSATLAGPSQSCGLMRCSVWLPPTGGAIADKIGSVTLVIGICFVIIVAALAGFVLLPASPSIVMIALVLMLLFCAAIFAMRASTLHPWTNATCRSI